ncbi:MAG: 2-oxo acid dehydrogenase subunit E2, partial [Alphaproteobacteria bacterium]|nr:2-oxo acid dehydrogenase subunit E2 [Alphaproteobacteria bacterium]
LVKPGDTVRHGDIIAVIETQKGAIEIEVFEDGTVGALLVDPGATVPVGTPMAEISNGRDTEPSPAAVEAKIADAAQPVAVSAAAPPVPVAALAADGRASPAARRMAAAEGIDLATIHGSGPDGAILLADVAAAASVPTDTKRPATGIDLDAMRRAIAAAMARSKREIPHFYLIHTIDMHAVSQWLTQTNADRPPAERVLAGVLMMKAVALALRRYPEFNGFFEDDAFRGAEAVHIGTAIAIRGGGLVAPAVHHVDQLSLDVLMKTLRDLTGRVRAGRIRSSELTDPTVTVSSLGERGVEALYGVIYPPQVALVGFGSVIERPWVEDGKIVARMVVTATLSADHRASDGHRGALFLRAIGDLLQDPEAL